MKTLLIAGVLTQVFASLSQAAVKVQSVDYRQDTTALSGLLIYDSAVGAKKKPGIVIFSDWMGVGDMAREKGEKLARMGFVVFAADVYGKGKNPRDTKEAGSIAAVYKSDRALTRARAQAGLDELRKAAGVDTSRVAAMGYCFGGMVALELARSGAPLKGVAVFHGNLDTPDPTLAKNIKGSIAVFQGAIDPYVPEMQVKNFMDEMNKANVDWRLTYYSGAVHAFTNPKAGNDISQGAAYNELADKRSWESMKLFYEELFPHARR
jgi:dienelactone hydrolase